MFEPEIEDAPCERCWKPVHLQHDPPCDHGTVQCAEHDAPDCCVAAEWCEAALQIAAWDDTELVGEVPC